MVQPLPCHTPPSFPAGDDLGGAGAVEVPWIALASPAASGRARGAPVRDGFVPSALAALAADPAPSGAGTPAPARTAASAGYAAAVETSSSTLPAAASAAKKATPSSTTAKKSTGPLAFLDDKTLSTSQKLIRLLAYLDAKWEKDIEKRMKELAATGTKKASSTPSSSSSSSSSSAGGLLGSVVRTVASVVPGAGSALSLLEDPQTRQLVSQVSGPVLAAGVSAFGFPELAPAALQLGPTAVNALASAAGSTTGTTAARSSSSSSSSTNLSPEALEKVQLAELQNVMDHQKELFSMVSNMLRAENDLRMNIIQNVR